MIIIDSIFRPPSSPFPETRGARTLDTGDPKLDAALREWKKRDAELRQFLEQHGINLEMVFDLQALAQALRNAEGGQGGISAEVLDALVIQVRPASPLFGLTQAGSGEVSVRDALAAFGVSAEGTGTASGLAQILQTLEGKSQSLDQLNQTQLMKLNMLHSDWAIVTEVCKKMIDIVADTNKSILNQR